MAVGLVNVSFSLPEWLAVKMIFFAPCSCVFKCLVILCIYFSILRFQHMKYLIHIFIISFLFSLFLSVKRLIESQRVKITLFKKQFCILVLWTDLKNSYFFVYQYQWKAAVFFGRLRPCITSVSLNIQVLMKVVKN